MILWITFPLLAEEWVVSFPTRYLEPPGTGAEKPPSIGRRAMGANTHCLNRSLGNTNWTLIVPNGLADFLGNVGQCPR